MSLTGHIDVFPLEEVLRLLARSYKSGCLRVDASDLHGRIFLSGGSLTFATVGTDEDMRRQLLASKVTSDEAVRAAEVGGRSLTDAPTETCRWCPVSTCWFLRQVLGLGSSPGSNPHSPPCGWRPKNPKAN